MMKKTFALLAVLMILSCNRNSPVKEARIITVSIAPFEYFVKEIAGDDFSVNIMVPPGANPHIYEPYPDQIARLRKSVAYISNGYLGFEMTWLDRFYEMNKSMIRLSLGEGINPIEPEHEHESGHEEGADPHYWVSPKCAASMAVSVRDLVSRLNPQEKEKYVSRCSALLTSISELDKKAGELFSGFTGTPFMIYHPNLAYLARDYGLEEVAVEFEGKEPPPSRLKYLIDLARTKKINTIFVQREYDSKNAKAIADEIGAEVVVIDPLSVDWMKSTTEIVEGLHKSFTGGRE
jgi:zinc transport system substrate-binding protein